MLASYLCDLICARCMVSHPLAATVEGARVRVGLAPLLPPVHRVANGKLRHDVPLMPTHHAVVRHFEAAAGLVPLVALGGHVGGCALLERPLKAFLNHVWSRQAGGQGAGWQYSHLCQNQQGSCCHTPPCTPQPAKPPTRPTRLANPPHGSEAAVLIKLPQCHAIESLSNKPITAHLWPWTAAPVHCAGMGTRTAA